jgi:hypothetical protein
MAVSIRPVVLANFIAKFVDVARYIVAPSHPLSRKFKTSNTAEK